MTNHFSGIQETMQADLGNTGESQSGNTQSQVAGTEQSNNPDQAAAASMLELDKLEKFKYKDQEWTKDELEKAIMRQSDYTKKTQAFAKEREQVMTEKKYADNLADDLENISRNPKLLEEFKKIYPKSYHGVAERYANALTPKQQAQADAGSETPQSQAEKQIAELLKKVEDLEAGVNPLITNHHEHVSQVAAQAIDDIFDQGLKKYELANEAHVHLLANQALERGEELTKETFDKLFKQSHDAQEKQYKAYHSKTYSAQKEANERARTPGGNSGTPSTPPPAKTNLKQAREQMLKDFGG